MIIFQMKMLCQGLHMPMFVGIGIIWGLDTEAFSLSLSLPPILPPSFPPSVGVGVCVSVYCLKNSIIPDLLMKR